MTKIFFFFFILLISCSKESEQNTSSSIEYIIEGTGTIRRIVLTVNPIDGSTRPNSLSKEFIESPTLPFTYKIPEYYPNRLEIWLDFNSLSDLEKIGEIRLIRNGVVVNSLKPSRDDVGSFPDFYYVLLTYEWGYT